MIAGFPWKPDIQKWLSQCEPTVNHPEPDEVSYQNSSVWSDTLKESGNGRNPGFTGQGESRAGEGGGR